MKIGGYKPSYFFNERRFKMKSLDEVNLKMCKYKVGKMIITIYGGEEYEVSPIAVGDILIDKDFDQYQLPFFRMTLGVPNIFFRKMKKIGINSP